jgi:GntR family transcriptional regulator
VPATVHDAAGAVGMVMDTAFPDDLHALPDAYPVT